MFESVHLVLVEDDQLLGIRFFLLSGDILKAACIFNPVTETVQPAAEEQDVLFA